MLQRRHRVLMHRPQGRPEQGPPAAHGRGSGGPRGAAGCAAQSGRYRQGASRASWLRAAATSTASRRCQRVPLAAMATAAAGACMSLACLAPRNSPPQQNRTRTHFRQTPPQVGPAQRSAHASGARGDGPEQCHCWRRYGKFCRHCRPVCAAPASRPGAQPQRSREGGPKGPPPARAPVVLMPATGRRDIGTGRVSQGSCQRGRKTLLHANEQPYTRTSCRAWLIRAKFMAAGKVVVGCTFGLDMCA
mmetsp:Transcript_41949/g.125557  ORF Transcript_41949/g.125557 Transcript_41949/m.125557 type:complete len:247 (-) Transcript_41949:546-1286(-)|eukprot:72859-Chlamydomonas_euryale.AAC.6